jgi:hypothetical protein
VVNLFAGFDRRGTSIFLKWNATGHGYSQKEEEERICQKYFLSSVHGEQLLVSVSRKRKGIELERAAQSEPQYLSGIGAPVLQQ